MLQGLGVATVGLVVLDGCMSSGSSLPTATSKTCGTCACIDLADPSNADLMTAGGAMVINTEGDTVMVIRMDATTVIALSAICTHAGCSLDFDAARERLTCPCHGSEFDETGRVTNGPARTPLKVYTATLANDTITVS